jgi:hypothetical protein
MVTKKEEVIDNLEGWIILTDDTSDNDKDAAVYAIKEEEVTNYIEKATKKAKGYTRNENLPLDNEIVSEAIGAWAAGLLWNKKIGDQSIPDKSDKVIYTGPSLIKEAKESLSKWIIPEDINSNNSNKGLVIGTAFISDD